MGAFEVLYISLYPLSSIYSDEEITKILDITGDRYMKMNPKRYRYAPMFVFILNTGIRIGECVGIKWSDVDFDNRMADSLENGGYEHFDRGWL